MYKELDDNELIYMIKEDEIDFKIMKEKYDFYIKKICLNYKNIGKKIGYELEDLMQVAYLGLYEALISYKDNQNTLFFTYLSVCIKNKILAEIKNNSSYKKQILNNSISYEELIHGTDISIFETISDKEYIDPLELMLIKEKEISYINFINSLPFEVAIVYELRINGFSKSEISSFLNIDSKTILRNLEIARIVKKAYI